MVLGLGRPLQPNVASACWLAWLAAMLGGCGEEAPPFHQGGASTARPDAGREPGPEPGGSDPRSACELFDDFDDGELDAERWGQVEHESGSIVEADGVLRLGASGARADVYVVDRTMRHRRLPTTITFTLTRDDGGERGFRAMLFSSLEVGEHPYMLQAMEVTWFVSGAMRIEIPGSTPWWTGQLPFEPDTPYEVEIAYGATFASLSVDGVTQISVEMPGGHPDGYHNFGFWDASGTIDDFCVRPR